jgi:hypothetical protein
MSLWVLAFSVIIFCSGAAYGAGDISHVVATKKKIAAAPPVPTASITLSCADGKKYTVTTGSGSGSCVISEGSAQCKDASGLQAAFATCANGCQTTNGTGGCQ